MGTVSLEADVFEMIRMITAKNATGACKKLQTLLRLQQEPIAITGAMIGSYVDLYRVKLGASKRKSYAAVFKDFGYKGSDYRSSAPPKQHRITHWASWRPACRCCWTSIKV